MLISNKANTRTGTYDRLKTSLLIGESNSGSAEISIQITNVEVSGSQSIHSHPENQCYYIIEGQGNMKLDSEEQIVNVGDAIFIPGNSMHGITNIGKGVLTYLTANKAFGIKIENQIWKD
jgi:quercetin dioxygenase-like cupin family protein